MNAGVLAVATVLCAGLPTLSLAEGGRQTDIIVPVGAQANDFKFIVSCAAVLLCSAALTVFIASKIRLFRYCAIALVGCVAIFVPFRYSFYPLMLSAVFGLFKDGSLCMHFAERGVTDVYGDVSEPAQCQHSVVVRDEREFYRYIFEEGIHPGLGQAFMFEAWAPADGTQLYDALDFIVGNGMKYAPPGWWLVEWLTPHQWWYVARRSFRISYFRRQSILRKRLKRQSYGEYSMFR